MIIIYVGFTYGSCCLVGMFDFVLNMRNAKWLMAKHQRCFWVFVMFCGDMFLCGCMIWKCAVAPTPHRVSFFQMQTTVLSYVSLL
jgi:uncharacterized membrane protein